MKIRTLILLLYTPIALATDATYDFSPGYYAENVYEDPTKTVAQIEREQASREVAQVKQQLEDEFKKCVSCLEEQIAASSDRTQKQNLRQRLREFTKQHQQFLSVIKKYSTAWGDLFGARASSHHQAGSMIDFMRLRIKHLKIFSR